jgi:hypothetical protein
MGSAVWRLGLGEPRPPRLAVNTSFMRTVLSGIPPLADRQEFLVCHSLSLAVSRLTICFHYIYDRDDRDDRVKRTRQADGMVLPLTPTTSGGILLGEFTNPLSLCHVCHSSSFTIELPVTEPVTHPAETVILGKSGKGALSVRAKRAPPLEVGRVVLA